MGNKRIQFVSDHLVEQILEGRKTASVVPLGEVDLKEDEYNDALVVGEYYDVHDGLLTHRATIRIVAMELCRWDAIPERLWRGEINRNADQFRQDHEDYFGSPGSGFEFVAYYFELAGKAPAAQLARGADARAGASPPPVTQRRAAWTRMRHGQL